MIEAVIKWLLALLGITAANETRGRAQELAAAAELLAAELRGARRDGE